MSKECVWLRVWYMRWRHRKAYGRLAGAALVFLCGAQSAFPQTQNAPAEVIRFLSAGDNEKALSAADHALAGAPRDCRLLTLKGMALHGLGREQTSLATFKGALAQCPGYLPALEGAAQQEYAGHGRDTVLYLNRILALQPENATAHAMLASYYRSRNNCAAALPHFEQSKALFASRPELLQGYGSCVAQGGNYAAALPVYQQLLRSRDEDSVRYDVAFLQWKTGAAADALVTLAPLLNAGTYEPALTLGAKLSEQAGDTSQAVKLLRAAILLQPENADHYLEFAELAFNHKSFQVGIDMIDAGLNRLPDAPQLYVARGVLETQLSKNSEAIADFEHAHELAPKLSLAVDAMGIMQSQMHHDHQSLALFQSAVKQHPNDPLLQYLLAEQLSQASPEASESNMKEAIAAVKKSIKLDPAYTPAHDLLATLYVKTEQPGLAVEEAKAALAQDPKDQVALYQEIMARRRSGNTAELRALTDKLNALRKENSQTRQGAQRYQLQDNISH